MMLDPLLTLTGRLRNEFLRWERLGRGHLKWNESVVPEPYFVPFGEHGEFLRRQGLPDDGRTDGLVGGLFRQLRAPVEEVPQRWDPLAVAEEGLAPKFLRDGTQDLAEAIWTVPESIDWDPTEFEAFLYSVGTSNGPVCLELIAAQGKTELQWAVEKEDAVALREAIDQLPFASALEWTKGRLESWVNSRSELRAWSREFALEREFIFPLPNDPPSDPLARVLRTMGRLRHSSAVLQIRFQPCRNRWAESLWRLVTGEDGKGPFLEDGAPLVEAVKRKCLKPFYAATVRLAVFAPDQGDVEDDAERLVMSIVQPGGLNSLVAAEDSSPEPEDVRSQLTARRFRRSGMILNADELLTLVHPPHSGAGAPSLPRLRRKTWPAPALLLKDFDLTLGCCSHGGATLACGISQEDRLRHMHVLGGSGTGKSTFLLNCILQDLSRGAGLAVLDPHGDLVDAVLERLPEERLEDVVLFDPSDSDWPVGFNILRAHNDIERNLLASDFVAIFERLSTSWGDQMTTVLGNAAMAFLESDRGGTLMDLKRFLIEKSYRDGFLRTVRDPEIRYFWSREFPLLRGSTLASLLTRLNGFLRHRLIRNMVAQPGERFDVARMMDSGKVILARLSQGLIGQENSWLLGSLLVSKIHQSALSRQAVEASKRRPFFLYLDEAHNFITPSISGILSGARKYGLGLVLAHQELEQFAAREGGVLGSILSNCHTRTYFRLGDRDAKRLEEGFAHFEATDFRKLAVGEAICRVGTSDADFSLNCGRAPEAGFEGSSRRDRAVECSRKSYAVPRRQMESESDEPSEGGPQSSEARPPSKPPARAIDSAAGEVPRLGPTPPPGPPSIPGDSLVVKNPEVPDAKTGGGHLPQPASAPAAASPTPTLGKPGRGGSHHKAMQRAIKQFANGLGLRATIEGEVPDGIGAIDVLVEGPDTRIAFEVAERSPLGQEVKNILKSLDAGIAEVVVVSADAAHLEAVRMAFHNDAPDGYASMVLFTEFANLGEFFVALGAKLASTQTSSRGYKVKVNYIPVPGDVRASREKSIHRAVASDPPHGEP